MIKRALFSTLAVLAVSGLSAWADDKADLQAAIGKLADAPNYSWSTTTENAGGFGGGGGGGAAPAPTTGMTEKGGYTVVTAPPGGGRGGRRGGGGGGGFGGGGPGGPGGPGGAPGGTPGAAGGPPRGGAGGPPAATPLTIVMKGDKAAVKIGEEWKTTTELQAAATAAAAAGGAGGPPGGGAPGGGGGGGFGGFGGGGPEQQALTAIQSVAIPTTMAKETTAKIDNVKKTADGFSADLTADTVKSMMAIGRGGRGGGAAGAAGGFTPPELTNPKGTINVTLANGVPSKIVVHTTGSMDFGGNAIDMDRTSTTTIKDVGTTKVVVPDDAKKKLDAAK